MPLIGYISHNDARRMSKLERDDMIFLTFEKTGYFCVPVSVPDIPPSTFVPPAPPAHDEHAEAHWENEGGASRLFETTEA